MDPNISRPTQNRSQTKYSHLTDNLGGRSIHGVVVDMLDSNVVVNKFKCQLLYHFHFQTNTLGKGMNSLIPLPSYEINSYFTGPQRLICH